MKRSISVFAFLFSCTVLAAGPYHADVNLSGESISFQGLEGRVHCDWYTSIDPPHFTVLFEGQDEYLFFMLETFSHNLLMSPQMIFDFRKDDTTLMSIARLERKSSQTHYDLDLTEEKNNCVVELRRERWDVQGTFQCSHLDRFEKDKWIGTGYTLEGKFSCPYSNS